MNNSTLANIPSIAEKYGYGTLAIVFICLLALLGIILLPCLKKSFYFSVLDALNGLAVGTLLSDAFLHMMPDVLNLSSLEKTDDSIIRVPDYIIKICVSIFCLYLFWLIEIIATQCLSKNEIKQFGHDAGHGHSHEAYIDLEGNTNHSSMATVVVLKEESKSGCCSNLKKVSALAWIIILGDGIHNLTDGLAVGASFSRSLSLGVSTSIAVICHEIPHELGNYAVLVKCGFSHTQALLFNLLSGSTSLVGFYIGVSSDSSGSEWILTITIGMFLYISLVELLPSLTSPKDWSWIKFLAINIMLWCGFSAMFLLVIFEEHIAIN